VTEIAMQPVRIACLALALLLAGCADGRPPDNVRVSTPCAPSLVSVAVLF
jgi:hypothetical protein